MFERKELEAFANREEGSTRQIVEDLVPEAACILAMTDDLSEEIKEALLAREDADKDYRDTLFSYGEEVCSIRSFLDGYRPSEKDMEDLQ